MHRVGAADTVNGAGVLTHVLKPDVPDDEVPVLPHGIPHVVLVGGAALRVAPRHLVPVHTGLKQGNLCIYCGSGSN